MGILKILFPVLRLITQIYFCLVNLSFGALNCWKPKRIVEVPNEEAEPLLYVSATEAASRIREGKLTSKRLIQTYIDRIKQVEPVLNAIVHSCYEEALDQANKVDQMLGSMNRDSENFSQLTKKKPLLGVPFLSKDNMITKGLVCICGHPTRVNLKPSEEDAEVIKRLREAGAILLAVTNLPTFARHSVTSNPMNGRTNNPYDLRRTPGGSSGGISALISSGASIFGLGNDFVGSVRVPSSFCGIFGLRPTPGTIPLTGMVPEVKSSVFKTLWTIGPMCRYAEDLELFYRVMVGEEVATGRLSMDKTIELRNLRVYYMEELNFLPTEPLQPEVRDSVRKVSKYLEKRFSLQAKRMDFPVAHHTYEILGSMILKEEEDGPKRLKNCLKDFLRHFVGRNYDDTWYTIASKFFYSLVLKDEQKRAFILSKKDQLQEQISTLLAQNGVLLFPSFASQPAFHGQLNFLPFNNAYTALFNALGLPSLACPIGLSPNDGLPLSVQVVGAPNSETLLFAVGKELERAFGGWTAPRH